MTAPVCTQCKGSGYFRVGFFSLMDCPVCEGTGVPLDLLNRFKANLKSIKIEKALDAAWELNR